MTAPFNAPPPAAVTRVLALFGRDQLASFVAVAIDLLDLAEDDCDLEDDDPLGQCDEDEVSTGDGRFHVHGVLDRGAGCPIADPGGCEHDGREPEYEL